MKRSQIIGHQQIIDSFQQRIQKNSLPQTMLFYGMNGIGKQKVAFFLAQTLLCEAIQPSFEPCDSCLSCLQMIKNSHPDFLYVEPTAAKSEKTSKTVKNELQKMMPKGSIKREQIDQMKQKLKFHPLMGSYQIIIINDAHLLTPTAANSLLKILEEPKKQQIFMMVTSQLHHILLTLRSRSAKFYFPPLSLQDAEQLLAQSDLEVQPQNQQTKQLIIEAFCGSPAYIRAAFQMEITAQHFEKCLELEGFAQIHSFTQDLNLSDESLLLFLLLFRFYLLQKIKNQKDVVPKKWLDYLKKIDRAEWQLKKFISKDFVLETLFL